MKKYTDSSINLVTGDLSDSELLKLSPTFTDELGSKIENLLQIHLEYQKWGEFKHISDEKKNDYYKAVDSFLNWYMDKRHESSYDF